MFLPIRVTVVHCWDDRQFAQLQETLRAMSTTIVEALERARAEISAQGSVIESAATGYAALAEAVRSLKSQPTITPEVIKAVDDLADSIDSNTSRLAAATAENTAAAPEVVTPSEAVPNDAPAPDAPPTPA